MKHSNQMLVDEQHSEMVQALAKPAADIMDSLDPVQMHLIHMILGVSGEAGELLDAIKKATIYNKPLDVDNVIEELGDIEFYLEGIRQALAIPRATTILRNMKKLRKRYGEGYSDDAAQRRKDKHREE